MKLQTGGVAPFDLCKNLGITEKRAAVFVLPDPLLTEVGQMASSLDNLGFKVVFVSSGLADGMVLHSDLVSCVKAPPASGLRFALQRFGGHDSESYSFVLDASGTVRAVCTFPADLAEIQQTCEQLATCPMSAAEAEVELAKSQKAEELAERQARRQSAMAEEARVLALVRSRRPPRPKILRGVNKIRWEAEEQEAVEAELRRLRAGTDVEAAEKSRQAVALTSRAIFAALVVVVAAVVYNNLG
eukprot:CAMPEP_0119327810 /NCGR_PEP_ID=MMETSP1333-20130426/71751_1 /TAXON_ID=418940 /ORGANISM="Scyphosphaera apsteinii, Strain RCC1455" /LENGTH=243 /DNA_ID=CAMNT_0007336511 /DNA_START=163 /DNA_END=894 /DNA_ORIENTATION=-